MMNRRTVGADAINQSRADHDRFGHSNKLIFYRAASGIDNEDIHDSGELSLA
jgi:hypothetical protein